MNKNSKSVWIVAILAATAVIIVLLFLYRGSMRPPTKVIDCGDGPRPLVDMDDFDTKYWAYSYEFQADIANRARLAGKIQPVQLQKLSDALQEANEFRKLLVAGYNSCAISKKEFDADAARFEELNSLSLQ